LKHIDNEQYSGLKTVKLRVQKQLSTKTGM
jgi:hypothetical protein